MAQCSFLLFSLFYILLRFSSGMWDLQVLENSPSIAGGMVYIGYLQREIDDQFKFVQDLERWVENTAEPVGATLTMRSVTVAVLITRGTNEHCTVLCFWV